MQFRIASMPTSRLADYCLGYFDDSVFIDFNNYHNNQIILKRISFDGYGCCSLSGEVVPMDDIDSNSFLTIYENQLDNQELLMKIILKNIKLNKELIWEEALLQYGLL